jgi:quinoprotein glucose dehydrogenase
LRSVGNQISYNQLRRTVRYGIGRMPPVQHVDEDAISDMYSFLSDGVQSYSPWNEPEADLPEGPVVQSGGAPRHEPPAPRRFNRAGDPYPEGVDAPADRYYTDYGLGHPYIMRPPWSTIQAYDLNTGTVKWKKALGQDLHATNEGGTNTGVPRGAQRSAMIVTSTGLVFSTAKDGHIYAFDSETGDTLWSYQLPSGTEGLSAMYELDGKQYLVVVATTPVTWGLKSRESGVGSEEPRGKGGYVIFTLLEKTGE